MRPLTWFLPGDKATQFLDGNVTNGRLGLSAVSSNLQLLAATAVCAAGAASAAGFDQFIGFGDSTMDSGYFRYGSTGGLFTLGANSTERGRCGDPIDGRGRRSGAFAGPAWWTPNCWPRRFGLSAMPFTIRWRRNQLCQRLRPNGRHHAGRWLSERLLQQRADRRPDLQLPRRCPRGANPNALYMISTGANDLFWMQTHRRVCRRSSCTTPT